jgi:Tol biopolymer transport system component
MKKSILYLLLIAGFISQLRAGQLVVTATEFIKMNDNSSNFYPRFSPVGDYLLLTSSNYKGLRAFYFSSRKISTITTDDGAGLNAQISADGKNILYNKVELIRNLRRNTLMQVNVGNGISKKLSSSALKPLITIEDRKMILFKSGTRKVLTPNGAAESYIWPVISPDGKKIAYTVVGKGTFVCNLNGSQPVALGYLNAPRWLNNQWIIGMHDTDDGEKLVSSELIAVGVDGKGRQIIKTPAGKMALYPDASADGKRIAFHSEKGEIYILTISIQ